MTSMKMLLTEPPVPFLKGERIEVRGFCARRKNVSQPSPCPSPFERERRPRARQIV